MVLAVSSVVAVAAFPLVSWVPLVLTPGRLIFALPSKDVPPMVLDVANVVAVAAFPLVSWVPLVLTPGRLIFALPSKDSPNGSCCFKCSCCV